MWKIRCYISGLTGYPILFVNEIASFGLKFENISHEMLNCCFYVELHLNLSRYIDSHKNEMKAELKKLTVYQQQPVASNIKSLKFKFYIITNT